MFTEADSAITGDRTAVYTRQSKDHQEEQQQRNNVESWLEQRGLSFGEVRIYSNAASGADRERQGFRSLMEDVEASEIDDLAVWELSWIAREPTIAEEFFALREDQDVDIHITNGMILTIPSEYGSFASFGLHTARQERERLIYRTQQLSTGRSPASATRRNKTSGSDRPRPSS